MGNLPLTRGGSVQGWPLEAMNGKYIVITGANQGIGYETAKNLSYLGANVIIACRSEEKGNAAAEKIRSEYGQWKKQNQEYVQKLSESGVSVDSPSVEFMKLDLASLKSVVDFCDAYKEKSYPLHRLICNAAIGGGNNTALSEDNFEMYFQVNYLSHLLMILRLLPIMKTSGDDCRVISLSSSGHAFGTYNMEKLAKQQVITDVAEAYTNSKLYQIMMTGCLERRLRDSNISCYSVNPGNIRTKLLDDLQVSSRMMRMGISAANLVGGIEDDVTKGAATSIYLSVIGPEILEKRGGYFDRGTASRANKRALNENEQEELYKYSLSCLKSHLHPDHLEGME